MSLFGKKKVKLTKDELAMLLKFLGEDSVRIFADIENPKKKREGFSTKIDGGTYSVKPTFHGLEFGIIIKSTYGPDTDKVRRIYPGVYGMRKVIEFSMGVIR